MKPSDYCPLCRGKGEVLTDEGYVPCPACALRAERSRREREYQRLTVDPHEQLPDYCSQASNENDDEYVSLGDGRQSE